MAAILCIDGELDVHDRYRSALLAARERRTATSRIGIAVGDLDDEGPIMKACELARLAPPGSIYVTGAGGEFELGSISFGGHRERWQVFEDGGPSRREWTVVVVERRPHGLVERLGGERSEAELEAAIDAHDRRVYTAAREGGGFVHGVEGSTLTLLFQDLARGILTARDVLLRGLADPQQANLSAGLDSAELRYRGGRWWGQPLATANRFAMVGRDWELVAPVTIVDRLDNEIADWFARGVRHDNIILKGIGTVPIFAGRVGERA